MPAASNRAAVEQRLAKEIKTVFRKALDGKLTPGAFRLAIRKALAPHLAEIHRVAAERLTASPDLTNATLRADYDSKAWATERAAAIADELTANVARGVAKRLPAEVLTPARATTLAVTETTIATTAGERAVLPLPIRTLDDAVKETEDTGHRAVWITWQDEKVCPICEPLDRTLDEVWDVKFPLGPPAHPNCRCHLEYIPANVDPTQWLANR